MGQIRIWHNLNFKKGRTKRLKCKNEDLNKNGFFLVLAKHGLNSKVGFKTKIGLIWERKPYREERGRGREGEEKRKKR